MDKYNLNQIIEDIDNRNTAKIKDAIWEINNIDLAEIIDELESIEDKLYFFREIHEEDKTEVFENLEIYTQIEIINCLKEFEIKNIVENLYYDDIVDLIEELDDDKKNLIKKYLSDEERYLINEFLGYESGTAGSVMTIEYVELLDHISVGEAMKHLKEVGIKKETIYSNYVVDEKQRLEGIVTLRKLVTSDRESKILDIMETDIISVKTDDSQRYVADQFIKYGFVAMPVVDNMDRLVGIVTYDDVMRIIEEEDTEDFHKMAAISPNQDRYLDTSPLILAKSRLPWIMILMLSATMTGFIINSNLDILGQFVILSSFIPMLTDTGGNAASQSSTLIIRGLATGEIKTKDFGKIILKEFKVSGILSMALIVIIFFRVLVVSKGGLDIALSISMTLIFTIFTSNFIGGILPIGAKKLDLDPAVMAVPLITTLVDAMSLFIYFSIARIILI